VTEVAFDYEAEVRRNMARIEHGCAPLALYEFLRDTHVDLYDGKGGVVSFRKGQLLKSFLGDLPVAEAEGVVRCVARGSEEAVDAAARLMAL
jgi:hypothetical protein